MKTVESHTCENPGRVQELLRDPGDAALATEFRPCPQETAVLIDGSTFEDDRWAQDSKS